MKESGIDRITDVIMKWYMTSPFFHTYGVHTTFVRNDNSKHKTMGVIPIKHDWLRIEYDEEFVSGLSESELEGVLLHEFLHIVQLTHDRRGVRVPDPWNIATDAVNNEMIMKDKIISGSNLSLPKDCIDIKQIEEDYDWSGSHIAEVVYDVIAKDFQNNGGEGKGDDGEEQSNEGKSPDQSSGSPCKNYKNWDNHSGLKDVQTGKVKRSLKNDSQLKEALSKAQAETSKRGWGNMTGDGQTFIENLLRPHVNWKKELRKVMKSKLGHRGKFAHKSWRRPHRRDLPIQDKMKSEYNVNIVIDTSGSTFSDLPKFFTEVESILKSYAGRARLIQFDTEVTSDKKYRKGDWKKVKISGLGGTDVQDLFDYIKTKKLHKNFTIIFTDGYFNHDFKTYGTSDLVWVTTGDKIPNMKNIEMKDY